jgi:hypothetical protein
LLVLEFGRGPDRKKRRKRRPSTSKAFASSIAQDTATGITASAADAALAYALLRRRGLSGNSAKNVARKRFVRSIPLTVGVSTLTGTYGGITKVLENKKRSES